MPGVRGAIRFSTGDTETTQMRLLGTDQTSILVTSAGRAVDHNTTEDCKVGPVHPTHPVP